MFSSEDDVFYQHNQTPTTPKMKEMHVPNYAYHVNLSKTIITPLRKELLGLGLLHLN